MARNTEQRRAIRRVMEESGRPLSPREILDLARSLVPGLGIATVYRAVKEADFFKLDEEYIEDPPLPGRGVDTLVVSAGGITWEVRAEYAEVERVDLVRTAVMKVVPPQAYSGGSLTGEAKRFKSTRRRS